MEAGLVSIITPCYNGAKYISETIESVIAQTYSDWEMIIIDDGSKDNSAEIINAYVKKDSRIRLIYQDNAGSACARNRGIQCAEGQYIALLDADDLWKTTFLEKQIQFMRMNNAVCVFCSYDCLDDKSKTLLNPVISKPIITGRDMLVMNYIGCLSGLYDITRHGKVYLHEELKSIRDDYAYWVDIVNLENIAYGNPEILAVYRVLASSTTGKKYKLIKNQYIFYRKYLKLNILLSVRNTVYWGIAGIKKFSH